MTSKSLCFKLMKEDLKRRVWTIALTVLGLTFTLLVPVAVKSSSYLDMVRKHMDGYQTQRAAEGLVKMVGVNGLVIACLLAAAVVWAVSGFRYLHNSRQVDFYHSIPVKRHQLFLASYFNGIGVPMAIYLIIQVLSVALVFRAGIGGRLLGSTWWKILLLNLVYYSMIYTTMVIAMMMTGNMVVALLGMAVFCGYGPAVMLLAMLYKSTWFHTFYETEAQIMALKRAVNNTSPFANYMFAIADFSYDSLGVRRVAGAAAVTVILAVIAYALYHIRPSEAAGKAVAFKKTESPIKHLIALPVGVVFGMFFYELRSTVPWAVFGVLCGTGLTCCIMEIIYHFDFRKLFANWMHLAACFAISLLLVLAGMYDWYGYDSWLPDGGSVTSAAVVFHYDDDWVTYGDVEIKDDYAGRKMATWKYEGQTDYGFKHMNLTDIYTVMELGKKGVEADKKARSQKEDVWTFGERCTIEYRLASGKSVYRQYYIPSEDMKPLKTAVYDSGEYKKGIYPVLEQTSSDVVSVWYQQYNRKESLDLTAEETAHLLAVYQKELEELSMAAREKELPIGTIQFRTGKLEEGIAVNNENDYGYSLEDRCYYPVYPSFTRTLEDLERAGIQLARLDTETVKDIMLLYYWDPDDVYGQDGEDSELLNRKWSEDSEYSHTEVYKEKEDLEILIPALVFMDYYNMNSYYELKWPDNAAVYVTADFDVSGNYADRDGRSSAFQINMNKLSEEEIEKFGLAKVPN